MCQVESSCWTGSSCGTNYSMTLQVKYCELSFWEFIHCTYGKYFYTHTYFTYAQLLLKEMGLWTWNEKTDILYNWKTQLKNESISNMFIITQTKISNCVRNVGKDESQSSHNNKLLNTAWYKVSWNQSMLIFQRLWQSISPISCI